MSMFYPGRMAVVRRLARMALPIVRRLRRGAGAVGNVRWVTTAFADFVSRDTSRGAMLAFITSQGQWLADRVTAAATQPDRGRLIAEALLAVGARVDDGTIWHKDLALRSDVDVSLQMKVVGTFIAGLAGVVPDV